MFHSTFLKYNYEIPRRAWRSFKNSARTDGLELGHWVKANTDPDAGPFLLSLRYYWSVKITSEYPFARYNAKSPDYMYSEEEYTKFLEGARLVHSPVSYAHSYHRQTQNGQRKRRITFSILFANTIPGSTLSTTAMISLAVHLARWR